jgi:condensin complex subunit 1
MESSIFRKLQDIVENPCRLKDWFPLAEQVINTIYALGEHPDVLCNQIIKNFARRAFGPHQRTSTPKGDDGIDSMDQDPDTFQTQDPDASMISTSQPLSQATQGHSDDMGDAFELSQLMFVVGHVAIKHIVFLEVVEREWKRQKDVKEAGKFTNGLCSMQLQYPDIFFSCLADKQAAGTAMIRPKDGDELEQVAGNAEDEIGDTIAAVRERELLYGERSLLAVFGPMIVHICGSPHKFKVRPSFLLIDRSILIRA